MRCHYASMASKGCVTVGSILVAATAGCGLLASPAIKLRRIGSASVKGISAQTNLKSPVTDRWATLADDSNRQVRPMGRLGVCQQCIPHLTAWPEIIRP